MNIPLTDRTRFFVLATSLFIFTCYALSGFLLLKHIDRSGSGSRWKDLTPALLATALQAIQLGYLIYPGDGLLNLGLFVVFSLISWLVCLQIMISSLYRPLHTLGIFAFPLTGIAHVLAVLAPSPEPMTGVTGHLIQSHIMISIIAFSLIVLSAIQAVTLALQEHAIRSHHPGGFIRFLPPLHDMETLLFQMLGFGFVFLSTALVSGVFFVDDLFAQHLVHKTVLSIAGWIILATLLFGRYRFGWRGKVAIRWTLTAFAFLMLAYFGSKLVLEYILPASS